MRAPNYAEPPFRRTVWVLHRYQGQLVLEERVFASDEATGEFSHLVRHEWLRVAEMDDPPPAKFEAVGESLQEGESVELDPTSDYWDDMGDDPESAEASDVLDEDDELMLAHRAGEIVSDKVIPALDKAVQRAARELASEGFGIDWNDAAPYIIEALARYILTDASLTQFELVKLAYLNTDMARQWFEDNLPE